MLTPRPTGDHRLDWHITMRLNRAAVDALEIERGITVLDRLAPEQDAWFRRFAEQVEGKVRWEDVAMEMMSS